MAMAFTSICILKYPFIVNRFAAKRQRWRRSGCFYFFGTNTGASAYNEVCVKWKQKQQPLDTPLELANKQQKARRTR